MIPIILDSVQDFKRLEQAAQSTKRYLFRFVSFFINNYFVPFCNSLFVFATILIMSAIFHIAFNGKYYLFDQETPLQICLSEFFVPVIFDNNFFSSARTQRGDTLMGFGLTTSFLMACHTYVIVEIFLRENGIIQFWNQLHFQYHLSLHPFPICPFANITHLLNFQSSTIGGKHLLLLNQFMNLFGMPPLLGGGKDGLKIGSVGLLLIVTEVQVVIWYSFMSKLNSYFSGSE